MRKLLSVLCVIVVFGLTHPATAQLRSDVSARQAPVKLYDQQDASGLALGQFFQPENFHMQHSFSMSAGSFGSGYAYGMYTNSVLWRPSEKLAARVDVSYLQDFGGTLGMDSRFGGEQQGRLFVRNAEVAYKPANNMRLHFQIRQSPLGHYAQPIGQSSRYGVNPADNLLGPSSDAR